MCVQAPFSLMAPWPTSVLSGSISPASEICHLHASSKWPTCARNRTRACPLEYNSKECPTQSSAQVQALYWGVPGCGMLCCVECALGGQRQSTHFHAASAPYAPPPCHAWQGSNARTMKH